MIRLPSDQAAYFFSFPFYFYNWPIRYNNNNRKFNNDKNTNSLVDEVLVQDATGDKVPMDKVVMLLWQFRDDPSVVTFMARFVSKVCTRRNWTTHLQYLCAFLIVHLRFYMFFYGILIFTTVPFFIFLIYNHKY